MYVFLYITYEIERHKHVRRTEPISVALNWFVPRFYFNYQKLPQNSKMLIN